MAEPGPPQPPAPSDPAGQPRGLTISWKALVAILGVLVVGLGAVVAVQVFSGEEAEAQEVSLEPVSTATRNPFMPPVGVDEANVQPPQGSGGTFTGDTPGLYGGTLNQSTCNAQQMVTFLQQDPGKAAAWSSVLGITVADIPGYVSELTPVLLRSDVYVDNHGYSDGRATTIPAVLQAGTAVLVNQYGAPVVKCYCGNPLTTPRVYVEPVYIGPRWPGFTSTSITIIQTTTVIIDTFTLVDPFTGEALLRPRGSDGSEDRPATPATTTTTASPTTLAPATTAPSTTAARPTTVPSTTAPAGPSAEQRARAKVERASRECYPFPAPIEDQQSGDISTRGSGPDSFIIEVVSNTVTGKRQVFTWSVNRATLRFTPQNDLARVASNHCSLLR